MSPGEAADAQTRAAAHRRHELLTPMNHIIGYGEMLLEEAEAAGEMALTTAFRALQQSARRLLDVITALCGPHPDQRGARQSAEALLDDIRTRGEALIPLIAPVLQPVLVPDLHKVLTAVQNLAGRLDAFETPPARAAAAPPSPSAAAGGERILVVDDVDANRDVLARRLHKLGYRAEAAVNGREALTRLQQEHFDLVLLDVMMPELDGYEVLRRMKVDPELCHLPVIMISALTEIDSIVRCIELGAEDYLAKPFNPVLLKARLGASLEKKRLRDRDLAHRRQIEAYTNHLEELVEEKVRDISLAQLSTIFALSRLAESRDHETGAHLERMREYCRVLAQVLAASGEFPQIDERFIEDLYTASPLHDIGKVGIPDHVLQKPGKLTPQEFEVMKAHALIGADTLRAVDREHPGNGFIRLGIEVAESHHERWDGTGYPHGLKGEVIPLSARILALADVYDALRSRRCYKPAHSHAEARAIIVEQRGRHFDPLVVDGFLATEHAFDTIWRGEGER